MNTRTTWTLTMVAVALFGYILLVENRSPSDVKEAEPATKLFPVLKPGSITAVEIERTNFVVRAERVHQGWRLNAPSYPAQSTGIEAFLASVTDLTRRGYVPPKEILDQPGGLSPFGLDPAQASVTLTAGTNQYRFRIGNRAPIPDQLYVQQIGAAGVLISEADILDHLPRSSTEWRDPKFAKIPDEFDRMDVRAGGRNFTLARTADGNPTWRLIHPLPARANDYRVRQFVDRLRLARVRGFVTDDPQADLENYGLEPPASEIRFFHGTNEAAALRFGAPAAGRTNAVYALDSARSSVVLVAREIAELAQAPYAAFRDDSLLQFDTDSIARLEVEAKDSFAVQRTNDGAWFFVGNPSLKADPALVRDAIRRLNRMRIVQFAKDAVTDFSGYGLNPPERRYIVRAAGSSSEEAPPVAAQIDFSSNAVGDQPGLAFARRPDEASLYQVRSGEVQELPAEAFELRDRQIWSIPPEQVTALEVVGNGRTNRLERSAGQWASDPIQNAAYEEAVYRLSRLKTERWIAKGAEKPALFGIPRWTIRLDVEREPAQRVVRIGRPSPDGGVYAATALSGDEPVVFELSASLFEFLWEQLFKPFSKDSV